MCERGDVDGGCRAVISFGRKLKPARLSSLGFGVKGSGSRVEQLKSAHLSGLGFGVQGSGFRVQGRTTQTCPFVKFAIRASMLLVSHMQVANWLKHDFSEHSVSSLGTHVKKMLSTVPAQKRRHVRI